MNPTETATRPPSNGEVLAYWAPHLAAAILPLVVLAFVLTGPHQGAWPLLWVLCTVIPLHVADVYGGSEKRAPDPAMPSWPFDALLFVLVALQFTNIALLVKMFSVQSFWSWDALAAILLVGASSGYSGIVVAHELIHRSNKGMQLAGRALLCTVMYEHFYTEHVRGHHLRVATPEDPATAHFGETFLQFFVRTIPAQFRSAWRLEAKRLGDEQMKLTDPRLLRSRVVHGLLVEWALALLILSVFGWSAFFVFLLQALFAIRALEVVNYFEHWGLTRAAGRVRPVDSWDTHSRFTYYALTGLTRHADHHAHAARPYQMLRVHEESPILPRGYIALFPLILARNTKFRELMTKELERRRLGPFADAVAE